MAAIIRPIRQPYATVYKLTDQHMQTHGGFQWKLHESQTAPGSGELCTKGWLHVYSHPDIAVLLNPIHANYQNCRVFEARASGVYLSDSSLKAGVSSLTLVRELPLPVFSRLEQVAWAIFVVRSIPNRQPIPLWETWADTVLSARKAAYAAAAADAAYAADAAAADAAAKSVVAARLSVLQIACTIWIESAQETEHL